MFLGLVVLVVPSGPTDAMGATLSLSPASGPAGTTVTVTGTGFGAGDQVQLTWDGSSSAMPRANVSRTGTVSVRFTVPSATVGGHAVGASASTKKRGNGASGQLTASAAPATFTLTVVAPSNAATATPASTSTPTAVPTAVPTQTPSATPAPTVVPTAAPTAVPTAVPTAAPTAPPPAAPSAVKLLFGIGPTVDSARNAPLVQDAPARLLSVWYNSSNDLGWITDTYHQSMYDAQYALGRSIHLIIWTGGAETTVQTPYGTACGRPYPLSDRFPTDMAQLAKSLAGSGQLYVTVFTEFQTFACTDNAWNPNAQTNAYWRALKDRYLATLNTFHQHAPGSQVSLGWGGWQTRWDDPAIGGGRSMFSHFADVMGASDFSSFQAMQNDSNVSDVRAMVNALNDYGPVMLAHHKPNGGSTATFDADIRAMLNESFLAEMTGAGLFAWSFMDQSIFNASPASYELVKAAVTRFGR